MNYPQKPRLALQIGVTGHRPKDLKDADMPLLKERITTVLQEIKSAYLQFADTGEARAVFAQDELLPPRLLSPLAEGADSLAAQAALDLGYSLHCPLPFLQADYLGDFKHDLQALSTFETLLSRSSRQLELDGSLKNKDKAYLNLGQFVLRHADILLAVWNGVENELSPGTAGVIASAIRQEIPVLLIDANAPHRVTIHDPREKKPQWQDWDVTRLAGLLRWQLLPRDVLMTKKKQKTNLLQKLQRLTGTETNSRKAYFSGLQAGGGLSSGIAFVYQVFFTLLGKRRPKGLFGGSYLEGSEMQWKIPGRAAGHGLGFQTSIKDHFLHADSLASFYADQYRGTFLLSFGLGAVAVLFALLGAPFEGLKHYGLGYAVAELITILIIAGLVLRGAWLVLHQHWLDFRLLAERLRQHACLQPVGGVSQGFLPVFHGKSDMSHAWVDWLVRAVNCSEGMPAVVFDQQYRERYRIYLHVMIKEQVKYHALNAERNEHIAHALHTFNKIFLAWIVVVCFLHIFCGLSIPCLPHVLCHGSFVEALYTSMAAVLPAFGAAVAGMLSQGEFERIAQRSEGMAEELQDIADNVKQATDASVLELSLQAHDAIAVMSQELSDWRVIFRAKPLEWHA